MNQATVGNPLIRETPVARLLRDIARKRAASLVWNSSTLLMFYALLFIVGFMQIGHTNMLLVMIFASLGVLVVWIGSRIRWRRMENTFFEQELEKYSRLIAHDNMEPVPGSQRYQAPVVVEAKTVINNPLTIREMEVLTLIAEGMMNKQVAVTLGISAQTVKNHMAHILEKLGVNDRTAAVLYAVAQGWIMINSPDDRSRMKADI